MEKKNWEPCPRCGSNRVQAYSRLLFALVGIAMIGISIWLLIIPFIGLFGILFGLFILILSPSRKECFIVKTAGLRGSTRTRALSKEQNSSTYRHPEQLLGVAPGKTGLPLFIPVFLVLTNTLKHFRLLNIHLTHKYILCVTTW